MALSTKQSRVKAEYKMYQDISDKIKLYDDRVVDIKDLGEQGLDEKMLYLLKQIYERKSILKEISELVISNSNIDKQKELEDKLLKSDSFFCSIKEEDKKAVEKAFETQGENLARTPEWQSFHMIFTVMDQLALMNRAEIYHDKLNELGKKAKNFAEVKQKTKNEIRSVEKQHLKQSYKWWDNKIKEGEKQRNRHREKYKKLNDLELEGQKKMKEYQEEYNKATEQHQKEQKKYGPKWVGQYGAKVEKIEKDMEALSGKLQKIDDQRNIALRALTAGNDYLKTLQDKRNNDRLNKALNEYENAYRETFEKTDSTIPQSVERQQWIESCQNSARKFMEKQKLHKGNHKNSTEFNAMMKVMDDILEYSEDKVQEGKMPPFGVLLDNLQKSAEFYSKKKNEQWRPFPTTMRTTRLKMADALGSWAESMTHGMPKGEPQKVREKDLTAFYESKGKEVRTPIKLGPNKLDHNVIPNVHKMLDKMNECFKDTLHMEENMEQICKDFQTVCTLEKISYSLGYESGDDVKNMKLSDVMDTLTQVYDYKPQEKVNDKTVEQELGEMDLAEL